MTDGQNRKNDAHDLLEQYRSALILAGRRALLELLLRDEVATMDDVRDVVTVPAQVNPTVLGAVPNVLARAGIIEAVGYRQSRRPESHARPIRVWRLIDRAAAIDWLRTHPALPPVGNSPDEEDSQECTQVAVATQLPLFHDTEV